METDRRNHPVIDLLANLKVAVAQLRLYPPQSPQVLKVATSAFQSVNGYLEEAGVLTLSRTPRGLLVNGRRLPATGEVANAMEQSTLQLLQEVQIKTITFRKGLSMEELVTFLHSLTKKFWDVKEGKEINRRLREARVFQITVDEVEYVAVGARDLVIEDAAAKLEGTNARVAEIMRTLDSVIESAVSEGIAEQVRLEIMKKLLEQDPTLLQKAQAAGLPGAGTGDAPGWLTFEQARQCLGDIARLLPKSDPASRDALRRVGHALIGGFRHDPVILALLTKFLSDEAADLLPSWLKEGEEKKKTEATAVKRAGAILALEEEEQLKALTAEGPALVKELVALKRGDLVEEVVTALTGFARHTIAERRIAAAEALGIVLPTLQAERQEEVLRHTEERTRSALNMERDPRVYPKMGELAASILDDHLRAGRFEAADQLLQLLKRHYQVKEASFPQRVELAFRVLERVAAGKGFPALVDQVRAKNPQAVQVLVALDAAAARFLVSEMKRLENAAERLEIAQLLLKAGPGAGTLLAEEAQKTTAPAEAVRLAEVLPHALPENMAELTLGSLLRHQALPVRRRAAALLAERAYGRAGMLLLDALRDEAEPLGRVALIDALRQLKWQPAVTDLCERAESRSEEDEVRIAACHALGLLGASLVVPVLARICGRAPRGLSGLLGAEPSSVRAAAARALARFSSDAEARQALVQAAEDPDGAVRTAARQSLMSPPAP